MESLEEYLKKNCQEEKLSSNSKLSIFFDIKQILEGNNTTLMNFAKLLLCISTLSSIKDKHLAKISNLEAETQNEYFSSVELFLKIDNNEKQNANFDINNLSDLNLSESILKDLNDLKEDINLNNEFAKGEVIDINSFKNDIINNIENDNLKPINVEKKIYVNNQNDKVDSENYQNIDKSLNNKDIKSDNPKAVIVEKKTYCGFVKVGQKGIPQNANVVINSKFAPINEISLFLSGGDFLKKKIDILEETLLKNSEMYNYVIDKYEKDLKNLKEELEKLKKESKDKIDSVKKEKEDYLKQVNELSSLKKISQSEVEKIKKELSLEKNKCNELKNKLDELKQQLNNKDIEISQLRKKIDELAEQKLKELSVLENQQKDSSYLKEQQISMLNEKLQNEKDRNNNLLKDFENYKIESNKKNNKLINQNNALQKQIDELSLLKQEIEKYKKSFEDVENENFKIQNENLELQDRLEAGGKLNEELKERIIILERGQISNPYFAKQIMSRTLYNFAYKLMSENN